MEPLDALVRAAQEGDAEAFNRIVERFRIVLKHVDHLTRGKRLMGSSLEIVADVLMVTAGPVDIAEINEVRAQVRSALFALPAHQRMTLVLFYGTGYTLKEIAAFLDVPITTVKKRLYDGRQRLKEKLIDVMRDVLQEQRPSISDAFPTKVRLLLAARLGDMEQIKQLLARSPMLLNMKSDPGEASTSSEQPFVAGLTALHEAAMHNHAQLVQLLCDYGASCNAR
jgi:RNA polymerase sigma factor (sigma-70 family)